MRIKLAKEAMRLNHIAMWNWIAKWLADEKHMIPDYPATIKILWPGFRTLYKNGISVYMDCFACCGFTCDRCPIRGIMNSCQSAKHPYILFAHALHWKYRKGAIKYARQMALLWK
jgi:hypothetical protein